MVDRHHQERLLIVSSEDHRYICEYRARHGGISRSEVVTLALRALRERELVIGYKELAEEYLTTPDELMD